MVARPEKASLRVVDQIVHDLLHDRRQPGDSLPPEKTMLTKYGVGRGTLREALRLLEYQGVLTMRQGPGGGPVLQDPSEFNLVRTLQLLLRLNHAHYRVVMEVRAAVEPASSKLAAARISEEDLERLRATVDDMRENLADIYNFLQANQEFHDIIAQSSKNVLFAGISGSLLEILDGSAMGIDYPMHRREAILSAHEAIFSAVANRDPDMAHDRMLKHVNEHIGYAERKFPELADQEISWDRSRR